jgi:hypothetical protein
VAREYERPEKSYRPRRYEPIVNWKSEFHTLPAAGLLRDALDPDLSDFADIDPVVSSIQVWSLYLRG